jgi:hypothetical protein
MSRAIPTECEHGRIIDGGDFLEVSEGCDACGIRRYCQSCGRTIGVRFCVIDGCNRTDTRHFDGYPDCVDLCPDHAWTHDAEEDPS